MAAVRGAASTAVRDALSGPTTQGRVLGVFRTAAYVEIAGRLVAVESHDALRLPCAVVLPMRSADHPFAGVRPGQATVLRQEQLELGPLRVQVVRWWRPRRPRRVAAPYDGRWVDLVAAALPPLPDDLAGELKTLVDALSHPRGEPEVAQLLGRGDGLTPAGDDVIAGLLVAASAAAPAVVDRLAPQVLALAPTRTTLLSAALLRHAADGEAIPALVDAVDSMAAPVADGGPPGAVVRLLGVGHTSGAALAHGAVTGARLASAVAARPEVA